MSITTTSNPIVLGIDNEQEDSRPAQRPVTLPGHAIEQIGSAGSSPLSSLPSSLLSRRSDIIGLPSSPRLTSTYPDLSNSTEPQPPAGFTAIQSTETLSAPEASSHSLPTPTTSPRRSVYPPLSQEDEEEIERLTASVAGHLQDFRNTAASVRPRPRKVQRFCWTLRPSTKMTETAEDAEVQRSLLDMDAQESQNQPSRGVYDKGSELWTNLQPDHPTVHHTTPEARSDPSQGSPMELMVGTERAPEASRQHEQDTPMELVTENKGVQMDSLPPSASSGHDFEMESSLRRQDSRNIADAGEEEPRMHKVVKTPEHAATGTPEPNDRNGTATGQEDGIVIRAPSIADHILQALTAKKKKIHLGSSVAIVLDVHDLSKTFTCPSKYLQDRIHAAPLPTTAKYQDDGVSMHMFTLDANNDKTDRPTPVLNPLGSMDTLETMRERGPGLFLQQCGNADVKQASSQAGNAIAHHGASRNWNAVFETLKTMIIMKESSSTRPRAIIKQLSEDASNALTTIEGIMIIAKLDSGLLDVVSGILPAVILEYIGNSSLYSAIAVKPASWLLLSITLQNSTIFKEAFCHIAALYPAWPWTDKPQTDLPKDLLSAIKSKARELEHMRISIDRQLSMLTLQAPYLDAQNRPMLPISEINHPYKYDVVNFWWHWVARHLNYLDSTEPVQATAAHQASDFCNPANTSCLSRASFYRALAKGSDAYLPFNELVRKFKVAGRYLIGADEEEMRSALVELKGAAAGIVAPLVQSSLQLKGSGELGYLSCVAVGEEEMVWKKEETEEEEDGEGGMEL